MEERQARIHDDLRGIVTGELLFSPIERAPYSIDGSIYEIDPLGVVVPRNEADVVSVVKYAAENQIPIHPRGAGTSLAGEPLGPGLVLDFSRHFRGIVEIEPDSITVEPGVVLDVVNRQLAQFGRMIGPDPSHGESRTIGGILGGDASGMRSLKYGTIGDYVESLSVVFANGETGRLESGPLTPPSDDEPTEFDSRLRRKISSIARHHADSLARFNPKSPRNRAGYALEKAVQGDRLDLARLVVGSEGTLAIITEARIRTVPIPSSQAVAVFPFARLADAAEAVEECVSYSPSSCDLFDWRSLRLARDFLPDTRAWIPDSAEALLMVEFLSENSHELAKRVAKLTKRIRRRTSLVGLPEAATRKAECQQYLSLRSRVRPLTMRIRSAARPVAVIEDVAVPPSAMASFLRSVQIIMKSREVSWTVYGHVGHGQLHIRPFLDLSRPEDVEKLEPLATDVYDAAFEVGGTVSGEHGCGLARTQFLRKQYGELFHAFRDIKDAFDPFSLLNPGKVIGDDPHLMTRNLRTWPEHNSDDPPRPPGTGSSVEITILNPEMVFAATDLLQENSAETPPGEMASRSSNDLRWPVLSMLETSSSCNGCGGCRTTEPDLRMCPTFRATGEEAATPRSLANLVRQIALGVTDPKLWGTEELKQNADLCIHCTRCRSECPAGVDVSSLMIEAKAAYVDHHGLSPGDWASSRMEVWAKLGTRFPIVANMVVRNPFARWLMDRFFGLSRYRRLPRFQRSSFLYRAARLGLCRPRPHAPGPRVAYFVDLFANYYDQELAEAVVAVLRQAGVNVFVPRRQRPSGMASLVVGDLEHARELAIENLRILGNAVRDGYTVVCSEPTATMMIKQEYPKLTEDLDARLVASNTMDLGEYLKGLESRGQLPTANFPIRARVGYHQPCHLRSLDVGTPGLDLLKLIPGLDVEYIDRGCSGMAGTYGLKSKNFRTSLRAGRSLLRRLRDPDIEIGSTECGACRLQMEHNSTKRTLHPIKLLSLAYGLNPQLLNDLRNQTGKNGGG